MLTDARVWMCFGRKHVFSTSSLSFYIVFLILHFIDVWKKLWKLEFVTLTCDVQIPLWICSQQAWLICTCSFIFLCWKHQFLWPLSLSRLSPWAMNKQPWMIKSLALNDHLSGTSQRFVLCLLGLFSDASCAANLIGEDGDIFETANMIAFLSENCSITWTKEYVRVYQFVYKTEFDIKIDYV